MHACTNMYAFGFIVTVHAYTYVATTHTTYMYVSTKINRSKVKVDT